MLSFYKTKGYSLTVWLSFEDIAHIEEPANRFDKEGVFDEAEEIAAQYLEQMLAGTPIRLGGFESWIDGDDIYVNYHASRKSNPKLSFDG